MQIQLVKLLRTHRVAASAAAAASSIDHFSSIGAKEEKEEEEEMFSQRKSFLTTVAHFLFLDLWSIPHPWLLLLLPLLGRLIIMCSRSSNHILQLAPYTHTHTHTKQCLPPVKAGQGVTRLRMHSFRTFSTFFFFLSSQPIASPYLINLLFLRLGNPGNKPDDPFKATL